MKPEQLLAALMLVSLTLGAVVQIDRGRALLANFIIAPALQF